MRRPPFSALGGYGERVEKAADIKPAIERGLIQNAKGIPALLEFITVEENRIPRNLPQSL